MPEFREYERFSTTVINASLMPVMGRYIDGARARRSPRHGYAADGCSPCPPAAASWTATRRCGCRCARSCPGPAGGVAGSLWIANAAGLQNFITCDMGGTSTDVCLIED